MTIYEINKTIEEMVNRIDPETGEIQFDPQELIDLTMERDEKIENAALYIKNAKAEANAIADEVKSLMARKNVLENKIERLNAYIDFVLGGEKFATAKAAISFRETKSIKPDGEFVAWAQINAPDLLRYKEPEADKAKIKDAMRNGVKVEHAQEVVTRSVVIK